MFSPLKRPRLRLSSFQISPSATPLRAGGLSPSQSFRLRTWQLPLPVLAGTGSPWRLLQHDSDRNGLSSPSVPTHVHAATAARCLSDRRRLLQLRGHCHELPGSEPLPVRGHLLRQEPRHHPAHQSFGPVQQAPPQGHQAPVHQCLRQGLSDHASALGAVPILMTEIMTTTTMMTRMTMVMMVIG